MENEKDQTMENSENEKEQTMENSENEETQSTAKKYETLYDYVALAAGFISDLASSFVCARFLSRYVVNRPNAGLIERAGRRIGISAIACLVGNRVGDYVYDTMIENYDNVNNIIEITEMMQSAKSTEEASNILYEQGL